MSVHKIVQVSASRKDLPEWHGISDLFSEVQIRSVLQHSWAAIQHSLEYKSVADAPREFRRRLVRLAGLLELADEEFASLKCEQLRLVQRIASRVAEGKLDFSIDVVSLREYIPHSTSVAKFISAAKRCNISVQEDKSIWGFSHLVQACKICDIGNIEDLEKKLASVSATDIVRFFERFLVALDLPLVAGPIIGDASHFVAVAVIAFFNNGVRASDITEAIGWDAFYPDAILEASTSGNRKSGA